MQNKEENFEMRPLTPKEIRNLFGVSAYVMRNMLDKHKDQIGERSGKFFTVKQVEAIFNCLGMPRKIKIHV